MRDNVQYMHYYLSMSVGTEWHYRKGPFKDFLPTAISGNAYIYVLIDSRTDRVRYIGKTKNLIEREYMHAAYRYAAVPMAKWFAELKDAGATYRMELLMTARAEFIDLAEHICIEHFRNAGCDLLNTKSIMGPTNKDKLIKLRKDLGMSQKEFAEEIGKSLRQIQYYETGAIEIPKVVEKVIDLLISQQQIRKLTR